MLFHTVIFWLKKNLTSEEKDFFFTEVKRLGEIPSVENFLIGTPANTTKRPVIDDSYDCYLTVVLKDLLAHDQYQEDPIHLDFIDKCKNLWEKVVIYDAD